MDTICIVVVVVVVVVPWLRPVCWQTSVVRSKRAGLLHHSILGRCGHWWGGTVGGRLLCTQFGLLKQRRKNGGLTVMESTKEQKGRDSVMGGLMQQSAGNRM